MTIHIQALEFDAIIGLLDHERDHTQRVRIDATITYDYAPPAYLDYAQIVEEIKHHIIQTKYELLEEALSGLHKTLTTNHPTITTLNLTIAKPDILPDCVVSIGNQ
jgi:dihydroneopterin aldolase